MDDGSSTKTEEEQSLMEQAGLITMWVADLSMKYKGYGDDIGPGAGDIPLQVGGSGYWLMICVAPRPQTKEDRLRVCIAVTKSQSTEKHDFVELKLNPADLANRWQLALGFATLLETCADQLIQHREVAKVLKLVPSRIRRTVANVRADIERVSAKTRKGVK